MSPPGPNQGYIGRSESDFEARDIYPQLPKDEEIPSQTIESKIDHSMNSNEEQSDNERSNINSLSSLPPIFPGEGNTSRNLPDIKRKGWKGLSTLEKSLYVALGVVSALCVALMAAVIILGLERNNCNEVTTKPTAPPPQTCPPAGTTTDYTGPSTTPGTDPPTTPEACPGRPPRRKKNKTSTKLQSSQISNSLKLFDRDQCVSITSELKNSSICLTPQCFKKTSEIVKSMDSDVDPCQDFYQFSCGNWNKYHYKPEYYMREWNSLQVFEWKRLREITGVLEKGHSLLDSRPLRLAKQFYHTCMHPPDDEVGKAEIKLLVEEMTMLEEKENNLMSLTEVLVQQRLSFKSDFLFTFSSYSEGDLPTNLSEIAVLLGRPTPAINMLMESLDLSSEHEHEPDQDQERRQVIHGIFRDFATKLWSLVFPEDKPNLEGILADVLEFERNLSEISSAVSGNSNNNDDDNTYAMYMDLDDAMLTLEMKSWLHEIVGKVAAYNILDESISEVVQVPIFDSSRILLQDTSYFMALEGLLKSTKLETIVNYLRLRLFLNYGPHAGKVFRNLFLEFEENISRKERMPTPRWITCARETNEFFGWTVSLSVVPRDLEKSIYSRLNSTLSFVTETLNGNIRGLNETGSADAAFVQYTLEKLDLMQTHVGFPDWWLNEKNKDSENSFVEKFYSDINFTDPSNYFQNYVETLMWSTRQQISDMFASNETSYEWPGWNYVTDTKAFFDGTRNAIGAPLGMLDWSSEPDNIDLRSIYYGSQGVEIAKTLLATMSKLLEDNDNVFTCFREQLTTEKAEILDQILPQLIHIKGALEIAFEAYELQTLIDYKYEPSLPGLQDFTPEQLFFLSFAQDLCTASPQSPESFNSQQIIVNSVMQNSVEFQHYYECSTSTAEDACRVF